jgi:hypothetical protein
MASSTEDENILAKLDSVVPVPATLDAFPKLPSTYKSRSEGRGYLTILVVLVTFMLMLNDIGEYFFGWPDFDFIVDKDPASFMNINVDILVNMPCQFLSVDLRDAIGDRLYLTSGFRRDGATFDTSQATSLQQHTAALTANQVLKQSRSSRGLFDTILRRSTSKAQMPKYKHVPDAHACRIVGQLEVKKVTANLHITTLGHGYASHIHVPHDKMNLSHVISEFSFGPYFPDITQPLDNSFEITNDHFVAYQYFLHVVPTTYVAPRSSPVTTNQYSVTHYTRVMEHGQGTPGIFFKFDLDPLAIQITQRTTSFLQLIIRCVGVIGGVFVCMGYAVRIGARAVDVVTGADKASGIVAAESSGVKVGLRAKWGGQTLRNRPNRNSVSWGEDTSNSPYASYAGTPVSGGFNSPYLHSPAPGSGGFGPFPSSPNPGSPAAFGPPPMRHASHSSSSSISGPPRTPSLAPPRSSTGGSMGGSYTPSPGSSFAPLAPGTPSYSNFPPTPNPANGGGFPLSPPPAGHEGPPKRVAKKDD